MKNIKDKIAIGIVLLLLIVSYHMSFASNDANEGNSMFVWMLNPDNSGIIQAGIAGLSLLLSLYNMYQQRKSTQRQVNLDLFDKRYKIYCSVKDIVEKLFDIDYPEQGADTWETIDKYLQYNEKACESIEACDNTIFDKLAADFLIDDSGEYIIQKLKKEIGIYIGIVCKQKNCHSPEAETEIMQEKEKINNCVKEFRKYMRLYLDFKKI